jgi:hypothetical protein
MRVHGVVLWLCAAAVLALTSGARGQGTNAAASVLYRMESGGAFEYGCQPPCMCPILLQEGVAGTMRLTRTANDGPWQVYKVTEVNWFVPGFGGAGGSYVTGSGEYRLGTPDPIQVIQQRLVLDLKVGDRAVQRFDSGQTFATAAFPRIDATISVNGGVCFDTIFDFRASPVPASAIRRQVLFDSAFIEGCYNPCDCALSYRPCVGTFDLVTLPATAANTSPISAVVNVSWWILGTNISPMAVNAGTVVRGYGIYRCEPVSASRRMVLQLAVGANTGERYDSGELITNVSRCGPVIDLAAATNGFVCFNRVFDLNSRPLEPRPTAANLNTAADAATMNAGVSNASTSNAP